jgi:hypothetical protein
LWMPVPGDGYLGVVAMRSMRWVVVTALLALFCAASKGQAGCPSCVGGTSPWQLDVAALSGEACCSPPGHSGLSASPGCCCQSNHPCCDNAWADYCGVHSRMQAFWSRVGTYRPSCYACPPVCGESCTERSEPAAFRFRALFPIQPTPAPPAVKPTPAPPAQPN